jgi:hypothetical protein
MKTPAITKGCAVRQIGDNEIGIVDFVDGPHASVDYIKSDGQTVTAYLPVSSLEIVHVPRSHGEKKTSSR